MPAFPGTMNRLLIGLMVAVSLAGAAAAASFDNPTAEKIATALDRLETEGDFQGAEAELQSLFDALVLAGPEREAAAITEAASALRLVRQVGAASPETRLDLLRLLRGSPKLARALVFLVQEDAEKPRHIYAMLERLRRERGEHLETYANLAAAICVVHDEPLKRNFNENTATAPDPVALFDFFVKNESRMFFGLKGVPAELLVYVVDVTASIEELQWAAGRYAGNPSVGQRFFEIQYDFDHYQTGAPKKCTLAGWNLPNILRYGGVCADQAYFAMTVGKAIGIPTAYTVGRGAEVGHAWVGFLETDGRNAWWNFTTGRYESYQGLKGVVYDPQTRRNIPDAFISLLAELSQRDAAERHAAAALTDAAARLMTLQEAGAASLPSADPGQRRSAGPSKSPDALAVLEAALRACPGYAPAWFAVRDLAGEGVLSLEQKKRWAGVLDRLCSSRYPDFSLEILIPMVESVEDLREQDRLWTAAFRAYQGRHDLAAEIRMSQAAMWEEAGEVNKAGQCYLDVINRYANAGPFVLAALARAEELLIESKRHDQVLPLFAQTWQRIRRPEEMAGMFIRQSNWFRVGVVYADRLEKAGMTAEATQVRAAIGRQQ